MIVILLFIFALFPSIATAQIPAALGWHTLSGTILRNVCAGAAGNCDGITNAWNSAVLDTTRNRLIIWGGGHTDYAGNEIYALNLDAVPITLTRLNNASSLGSQSTCVESIGSPTAPNSRHTYNGLQYIPYLDWFWTTGGSLACPNGSSSNATWRSSLVTLASSPQASWSNLSPTGVNPGTSEGKCTAYDKNTGKVFLVVPQSLGGGTNGVHRYNPTTNVWARDTNESFSIHMTCVIDPRRKTLWMFGASGDAGGGQWKWDIKNGTAATTRVAGGTTGGTALLSQNYPGCDYDWAQDRIVCWNGGNTVYTLNLDTLAWSTATVSGGPAQVAVGTLGRFRYSPESNVFVTCQDVDSPCAALRLTVDTTPEADLARRCGDPGVLKCVTFDTTVDTQGTYGDRSYLMAGTSTTAAIDTSVKASGGGSLRFTVPAFSGSDGAGEWATNLSNDLETQCGGTISTCYLSYRVRYNCDFIHTSCPAATGIRFFSGAGGWKTSIFGTGDKPGCSVPTSSQGNCFSSCTDLETVVQNTLHRGIPNMYQSCPGPNTTNLNLSIGGGNFNLQPAMSPACSYQALPAITNCFPYYSDEWMTFKYKITLGTRSGNYFLNSTIDLWIAREGQAFQHVVTWGPFSFYGGIPSTNQNLGKIHLLPYNTSKSASESHPTGLIYYDELIISRTDIAAPGQLAPLPNPPSPPTGLTITTINNTQINLSWTAAIPDTANGAVIDHYSIERCTGAACGTFFEIGTSTGVTYSDTGLTPQTTYNYRIRAIDNFLTFSIYSSIGQGSTSLIGGSITGGMGVVGGFSLKQ